jgi:hypothetical protein
VFGRGPTARDTGDAQADRGGVAVSGIHIGDIYTQVPTPMTWPVWVGVMPPEADCYQPRIVADRLAAITSSGGTAVLCQVLSGLGGVGKTQVAAAHARQLWGAGELDLMVWVSGASRSAILAGYAQAYAAATGRHDPDAERAASGLLAWLAGTERRWMIVLDDLTDPGALRGLWPPHVARGRTMVTTRRRDAALAGSGRVQVDVDLFTPAEAEAYLNAKLATRPHLAAGAAGLAQTLGHLPLALAQATAYLIDRNLTCDQYVERLRQRRLKELLPEPEALPDDHRLTVAAAWALSIDLADSLAPAGLARPALQLASLLDPEGIPETVLTTPAATRWLSDAAGREVDAESASDALGCLHRLSLAIIDQTSSSRRVRVHALVQRATRDHLDADRAALATRTAADALAQAWPDVERDAEFGQALRASTAILAAANSDCLWTDEGGHPVLLRSGTSLGQVGQTRAAAGYFEELHRASVVHLDADHLYVLNTRFHLAHWRGVAGDAASAAAAFAELLDDHQRVLGPRDLDTMRTRHELAHWRGEAGDAACAVAALEELLGDHLRALGPDHPDTLGTRRELARWRGDAGDAAGAAAVLAELLIDHLRVLGTDHPHTLTTRHDLARWRGDAGDATGAVGAFEEVLDDFVRVLGPHHPDTLNTRHARAYWLGAAGDAAGAATAFRELLDLDLRVLGPHHPDTLRTRHQLARWRGTAGDAAGAATAFQELLDDDLRVLESDARDILNTRHSLAYWRGEAGDAVGAVAAFEKLLDDDRRVLGPRHPDTLRTRQQLARWQGEAGDAVGAVAALKELMHDYQRVLGPDHPDALNARRELARWQGKPR